MSSTNRTEEDWFLRGGERPRTKKNGGEREETILPPDAVCQNCGNCRPGGTERCQVCGVALTGGASTDECCGDDDDDDGGDALRLYEVEVSQTKTISQTATVRIRAASEDDAMDLVEERAANGDLDVTDLDWTDVEDSDEYGDFMAEDAVEAEEA